MKMWVNGTALVLLIAALPLISIGTIQDTPTLWWAGLALLVVAGAAPPVTRFAFSDDGKGDDEVQAEEKDEGERKSESEQKDNDDQAEDHESPRRGTEDPDELRARAHEERAAAHRERARSHEELAAADEAEARAREREEHETPEEGQR
jgi:hypothetical protein